MPVEPEAVRPARDSKRRGGWRPVLLVLVIAPVTAEYLIGYDDTLTNPAALIFGILVFGPLYGAPAVLIRETARRTHRSWATILLLSAAAGLIQAGLIDQSLFAPDYRGISYWQSLRQPTFLPGLGTSAYMLLAFVGGHVFGSFAAPIALAESWWPASRTRPWLGVKGLILMGALWLCGAGFVLADQFDTSDFRISPEQLVITVIAVVALVVLALTRRPASSRPGTVPAPLVVAVVSAGLLVVRNVVPTGWFGTALGLASIALWLALMGRWAGRQAWTGRHVLAAVVGDLLAIGVPAFWATPLGHLDHTAKLAANSILLLLVLAVAAQGYRREGQLPETHAT
jgi:hypothetical protein